MYGGLTGMALQQLRRATGGTPFTMPMQTPTREQLQEVADAAVNLPIHTEARFLAEGAANIVYTLRDIQQRPVFSGVAVEATRNGLDDNVTDDIWNSKSPFFLVLEISGYLSGYTSPL